MIEVRAFRGTRRSSLYRSHRIGDDAFAEIERATGDRGVPALAKVAADDPLVLDKRDARRLAEDVTRLRLEAKLLELDDDLTALAEVANWCARASGGSWLQIQRDA